jgi:hypothetical protein
VEVAEAALHRDRLLGDRALRESRNASISTNSSAERQRSIISTCIAADSCGCRCAKSIAEPSARSFEIFSRRLWSITPGASMHRARVLEVLHAPVVLVRRGVQPHRLDARRRTGIGTITGDFRRHWFVIALNALQVAQLSLRLLISPSRIVAL